MASIFTTATTAAADAAATSLFPASQIKPGDVIPDVPVKENNPEKSISLANLLGKNIIIGIAGAFTPPCSSHIPGYISKYNEFVAKGVKGIYIVAVNDAFVTNAWKEKLASGGTPIHFIADDKGTFSSAIGLTFDASSLLGGPRSKRYALIVEDGKVLSVHVEANAPEVKETAVDKILSTL